MNLKEVLERLNGGRLPLGRGSASRDDPLVITEIRDYVAIEHWVAERLLRQLDLIYEQEEQVLHNVNGRKVDELVYATRRRSESDWSGTRSYFFDITAGFTGRPDEDELANFDINYVSRDEINTQNPNATASLNTGASAGMNFVRWVGFLPVALIASWLATRLLMYGSFAKGNNPYIVLFVVQAVAGGIVGWVGVKIAPQPKLVAMALCTFAMIGVGTIYFLRYSDVLGFLAAATGIVSAVVAGKVAADDA